MIFLEFNHRILYFTYLKLCGKNFMNFDHTNWRIFPIKVGERSFFEHWLATSNDFDCHLWKFFALWTLTLKKFIL